MNDRIRHARPSLAHRAPRPIYRASDAPNGDVLRAQALIMYARLALCECGIDPDGAPSYVETLMERGEAL
jgi:hypothetical protein